MEIKIKKKLQLLLLQSISDLLWSGVPDPEPFLTSPPHTDAKNIFPFSRLSVYPFFDKVEELYLRLTKNLFQPYHWENHVFLVLTEDWTCLVLLRLGRFWGGGQNMSDLAQSAYMKKCQHSYMLTCQHVYIPACQHTKMPTCLHTCMPTCQHAYMPTC